jgi:hypothetical protein
MRKVPLNLWVWGFGWDELQTAQPKLKGPAPHSCGAGLMSATRSLIKVATELPLKEIRTTRLPISLPKEPQPR